MERVTQLRGQVLLGNCINSVGNWNISSAVHCRSVSKLHSSVVGFSRVTEELHLGLRSHIGQFGF